MYYNDSYNLICVPTCPSNYTFQSAAGECLAYCPYSMYRVTNGVNVCQDSCITYLGLDSTLKQQFSSKHYRCVDQCAELPLANIVSQTPKVVNRTSPTSSSVSCVDSCRQTNNTYRLRTEKTAGNILTSRLECANVENCAAYQYFEVNGSTMCMDNCSGWLQMPTKECVSACPKNYFRESGVCVRLCSSSLYKGGVCLSSCEHMVLGRSNQFECVDDCPENMQYHLGSLCVSSCEAVNAHLVEGSALECV